MIASRRNEHSTQQTQCIKQPIAMATGQHSKVVWRLDRARTHMALLSVTAGHVFVLNSKQVVRTVVGTQASV